MRSNAMLTGAISTHESPLSRGLRRFATLPPANILAPVRGDACSIIPANEATKDRRGDSCLDGKFPRDVRLHGLWLLRRGDRARLLPDAERVRFADAVLHDFRHGLLDASARRDRAGRLHRPPWPAQRSARDTGAHGR